MGKRRKAYFLVTNSDGTYRVRADNFMHAARLVYHATGKEVLSSKLESYVK